MSESLQNYHNNMVWFFICNLEFIEMKYLQFQICQIQTEKKRNKPKKEKKNKMKQKKNKTKHCVLTFYDFLMLGNAISYIFFVCCAIFPHGN